MTEKSLGQKYRELSEAYARAILTIKKHEDRIVRLRGKLEQVLQERSEARKQRDALKNVAKEVLFVLEKAGLYHKLQEQLQLAIGNLPKEAAKQNQAAEDPPPNQQKGNNRE